MLSHLDLQQMVQFFDAPASANALFPAHGWLAGPTGVPCLRFPIQRLYQLGEPTHKYFERNDVAGVWLQTRTPTRTLRHLTCCLRDLHREVREILPLHDVWDEPASDSRDDALDKLADGKDHVEILLLASFTLLRRLADEIIDASRPFMFEHWQSAPQTMKVAKSATESKLEKLNPICDIATLKGALTDRTAWFEQLRQDNGVRDILVHKPHMLNVGAQGTSGSNGHGINWRLRAHLVRQQATEPGGLHVIDLFPALLTCLDGACDFMESFVRSVGSLRTYERGDLQLFAGPPVDTVGCWPLIGGKRTEFPLLWP